MSAHLHKAGLKVYAGKSCFGAHKFEYLGNHVTHDGVIPIPKKVESIQALEVPKPHKKLCWLIGMINLYRDMWQMRSGFLAPLTALTSKNVKYERKYEDQKYFYTIKHVIGNVVFLAYPVLQCSA